MPTVYFNQSTASTFEVVAAPGAGKSIVVLGVKLMGEGDCKATLKSGSTALTAERIKDVGGSALFFRDSGMACAPNEALNITLSAAVAVYGHVDYTIR